MLYTKYTNIYKTNIYIYSGGRLAGRRGEGQIAPGARRERPRRQSRTRRVEQEAPHSPLGETEQTGVLRHIPLYPLRILPPPVKLNPSFCAQCGAPPAPRISMLGKGIGLICSPVWASDLFVPLSGPVSLATLTSGGAGDHEKLKNQKPKNF